MATMEQRVDALELAVKNLITKDEMKTALDALEKRLDGKIDALDRKMTEYNHEQMAALSRIENLGRNPNS